MLVINKQIDELDEPRNNHFIEQIDIQKVNNF